jgi:hypothetical protein
MSRSSNLHEDEKKEQATWSKSPKMYNSNQRKKEGQISVGPVNLKGSSCHAQRRGVNVKIKERKLAAGWQK